MGYVKVEGSVACPFVLLLDRTPKGGDNMCEWLMFLMLLFGCDVCDLNCEASLSFDHLSGNRIYIKMLNNCSVSGVQFTIEGCKVCKVETIRRARGFFVKYNEHTGSIVLVSLSGHKILPGFGPILILHLEDGCISFGLTDVKISCY